jgi:hypothetical protein
LAGDFYDQLVEILERHGCRFVRSNKHPIWHSPINNRTFSVPKSKSRHTANDVLRQAGIRGEKL